MYSSPLISIIIPVYNTEFYLSKCLDSAVNQTFKDIEIILVDDGSLGNCKEICAQYPLVKYISYGENRGLFRAREEGVRSAQGEYILHLDSDDWLPLDACEHIATQIRKTSADILMHGSKRFLPKNILKRDALSAKLPLLDYFTNEKKHTHIFLWQLTIKKEILLNVYNDLKLTEHFILSEDVLHFYCCLYYAKTWGVVSEYCYFYNESSISATRKQITTEIALKDLKSMEILIRKLKEFRILNDLPENIFTSIIERQLQDRLGEFKASYKNLYWNQLIPRLGELFSYDLLAENIFNVLKTPSMKIPQRQFNYKLIKLQQKIFPDNSLLFNILQSLWWKIR
ncbi:MAG: glycosyltransferase family 2 protein [Brevinema sp.]